MRHALTLLLVVALGTAMTQGVSSHEPANRKSPPIATEYGMPGNARDVQRTVDISLLDTMRIQPAQLAVRQGETVRLRIRNTGAVAHEFVLGTKEEIVEHRDMMRRMPTKMHDEANAVGVAPGGTADVIWRFSKPGTFLYACLVPGHWEAGMQGTVTVSAAAKPR
jgi:uncharacterized cupredoxin-like copper-binding protein